MNKKFKYEHELKIDKELYFDIWNTPSDTDKIKNQFLRKSIKLFFIILFLFSPLFFFFISKYTIPFGVFIIIITIGVYLLYKKTPNITRIG